MDAHGLEPTLRDVLRETLDVELGPHPVWSGSPAARRVAERKRSRWPLRALAAAAAVLVVVAVGYPFLQGNGGIGGRSTITPSPSPALLARGTFVIRDWGPVEFEATREGSSVTGRMEIGRGRGAEWPITVDLQCTRTTDDGLIMIGGYTDGGAAAQVCLWEPSPRSPSVARP